MTTILEGLSILESEHAFIVQEVRIEVAPLNQYVEAAHYFEAWEVKDGKVMGVKDADCDDMYITVKMYPCSGGTDTGSPEL